MYAQRQQENRAFQVMREPGPGSLAVGYVLNHSEQATYSLGLALQKRGIAAFAERKGWKLIRCYEEGIDVRIILKHMRQVNRYLASLKAGGKEEN